MVLITKIKEVIWKVLDIDKIKINKLSRNEQRLYIYIQSIDTFIEDTETVGR